MYKVQTSFAITERNIYLDQRVGLSKLMYWIREDRRNVRLIFWKNEQINELADMSRCEHTHVLSTTYEGSIRAA